MHDATAELDQSLVAGIKGYAWLPDLRRRHHDRPVRLRVLGRRAVATAGPDAVRFFYDESHLERHSALPHPVVATLFGKGAVHTLDAEAHRHRKALSVALLMNDGVDVLAELAGESFDEAAESWRGRSPKFRPERFVDRPIGEFELIPQGGRDPRTGHRCPGEQITVALLGTLVQRLAQLDHYVPPQDLSIDLSRIPARPASGVQIAVA